MLRPLSDLIREGASIRPQIRGGFIQEAGSCALGAAGEAAGAFTKLDDHPYLPQTYWYVMDLEWLDSNIPFATQQDIMDMNDGGLWTREEIADWLVEQGRDVLVEVKKIPAVLEIARERELVTV